MKRHQQQQLSQFRSNTVKDWQNHKTREHQRNVDPSKMSHFDSKCANMCFEGRMKHRINIP